MIGLGCRFPGADSPEAFWRLLHEGRDAIADSPADRPQRCRCAAPASHSSRFTRGGFLEGIDRFDPQFFGISPREAEKMDPQQRLLLGSRAGKRWSTPVSRPDRVAGTPAGVFIGISGSDYGRRLLGPLPRGAELYAGTGNALSIAANRLSYVLDFRGPSWRSTRPARRRWWRSTWRATACAAASASWRWPAA